MTGQGRGDDAFNFATTNELTAALAAKKISALELTDHFIARIEALDGKINAVVVRYFDAPAWPPRPPSVAGARRKPPAARHSDRDQGIVRCRRAADHLGRTGAEGFVPAGRCAHGRPRQGCRRDHLGKTNVPYVLGDWQSLTTFTARPTIPGTSAVAGRIVGWIVGRARRRFGAAGLRSARTSADRCACPRTIAASTRRSRPQFDSAARPSAARHGAAYQRSCSGRADGRSAADLELVLDLTSDPDEGLAGIGYRLVLPKARHTALKDFRVLVVDEHPCFRPPPACAALDRLAQR